MGVTSSRQLSQRMGTILYRPVGLHVAVTARCVALAPDKTGFAFLRKLDRKTKSGSVWQEMTDCVTD